MKKEIHELIESLRNHLPKTPLAARERAVVKTKLQEALMWWAEVERLEGSPRCSFRFGLEQCIYDAGHPGACRAGI